MRKIPNTISEKEFIEILKKTHKKNHRIAFILGFYGGMRVSEIVNLKSENIDKGQKLIRIKQGKGKKDRNIPIPPQSTGGLKYIPINIGVRALQHSFNKKSQEVLGKKLNFHLLRHSGASYYINEKGWSTREIQVLLGHSKVSTTEIYTHIKPENLINKMWGDEK